MLLVRVHFTFTLILFRLKIVVTWSKIKKKKIPNLGRNKEVIKAFFFVFERIRGQKEKASYSSRSVLQC